MERAGISEASNMLGQLRQVIADQEQQGKAISQISQNLEEFDRMISNEAQKAARLDQNILEHIRELSSYNAATVQSRLEIFEDRRTKGEREKKQSIMGPDNELVHDGDIAADIFAMKYAEERYPDYAEDYKSGFKEAYSISYEDALQLLPSMPVELKRTFNIHASIHELDNWQQNDDETVDVFRKFIQARADRIIATTLTAESTELPMLFDTNERLRKDFEDMQKAFG